MAKEVAISKRLKISQAQQYMILAVLGASVVLGVSISLVSRFVQQISFNAKVIAAEEASIVSYSDVIKNVGICKSPNGTIYSDGELAKCDPNSIEISEIPGTLRANILQNLAANEALNSVPKDDDSSCINPATGKNFTYEELNKLYSEARGSDELQAASVLIKSCSALRVIPDALPFYKNEEALLASLNKIYLVSNWEPETIRSNGDVDATESSEDGETTTENLNAIALGSTIEADSGITMNILHNIERSIREFNMNSVVIEWSNGALNLQFKATAYYVDESSISETEETITAKEEK